MLMDYELFTVVNTKINEEITARAIIGVPLSTVLQQIDNENTDNEVVTYALCHQSLYLTFANFSKALSDGSHVFHKLAEQYCDDVMGYYLHIGAVSPVFSIIKVYTRQRTVEVLTDSITTDKGELIYTVKEKIELKQNGGNKRK